MDSSFTNFSNQKNHIHIRSYKGQDSSLVLLINRISYSKRDYKTSFPYFNHNMTPNFRIECTPQLPSAQAEVNLAIV